MAWWRGEHYLCKKKRKEKKERGKKRKVHRETMTTHTHTPHTTYIDDGAVLTFSNEVQTCRQIDVHLRGRLSQTRKKKHTQTHTPFFSLFVSVFFFFFISSDARTTRVS